MAKMALYRAWRPLTFDDVVGQDAIVQTLRQALLKGEPAHAYLFCGTRGTGKTSVAKILSRAVNCPEQTNGNPCNHCEICTGILNDSLLDVQEIDAASNNSVDNVRRILEELPFLPIKARYKVYIIDEVHMLSSGAFNALLKTLEEPPAHVIFILATTEVHRLPATIRSRCQRFDFRRIPDAEIVRRLRRIADEEDIVITDEALAEIARYADGALRDAISLLDQCRQSFPEGCEAGNLLDLLGRVSRDVYASVCDAILAHDRLAVLNIVQQVLEEGRDLRLFASEFSEYIRDLMVVHLSSASSGLIHANAGERAQLAELAQALPAKFLQGSLRSLQALLQDLRFAPQPRISLELCLLNLLAAAEAMAVSKTPPKEPEVALNAPARQPEMETAVQVKAEPPAPSEEPQTAEAAPGPMGEAADKEADRQVDETENRQSGAQTDELSAGRILDCWQDCLKRLSVSDLYLYFFAKEAKAEAVNGELRLRFAHGMEAHYNVLSGRDGEIIWRLLDEVSAPLRIPHCLLNPDDPDGSSAPGLETSSSRTEDASWIDRIEAIADEAGVPFERVEES